MSENEMTTVLDSSVASLTEVTTESNSDDARSARSEYERTTELDCSHVPLVEVEDCKDAPLKRDATEQMAYFLDAQKDAQKDAVVELQKEIKRIKRRNSMLVLVLFVMALGMLAVGMLAMGGVSMVTNDKFLQKLNTTLNAHKDIDDDMIRRIASSMLLQQSVLGSDNDAPHSSTLFPLRTKTATTTTTTAAPTTYKHWDWRTNCGVKPLNHTGSLGDMWPWEVLVREMKYLGRNKWENQNKCGGVLLNSKFVLTSAHCLSPASFSVGLGKYTVTQKYEPKSEVTHDVRRVIVHPNFVDGTFDNDLALMELNSEVTFQEHILPICLPKVENDYAGDVATVAGWGSLRHGDSLTEKLQEVKLHIITNSECQDWFQEKNITKEIKPELMCAGYRNSCEGNSGGPLMLRGRDGRWLLVGAVSRGIKCAKPILPGVYMRMSHYQPWIEDKINT